MMVQKSGIKSLIDSTKFQHQQHPIFSYHYIMKKTMAFLNVITTTQSKLNSLYIIMPTCLSPYDYTHLLSLYTSLNRMPKATFSMKTSFEKLFGHPLDYFKLKVFGCLHYLWLRLYRSHKFAHPSHPCVFLSYSSTQSAYQCYDSI